MKNPFYIFITILLSLGCSEKKNSNLLTGNWMYYESDSTYAEVYINGNELNFINEHIGPIPYTYVLKGDSLIITNYDKSTQRKWRVNKKNDSTIVLKDSKETIQLNRLNFSFSYFDALEDSLLYEKFEQEFHNRYMKFRVRGTNKNNSL